MEMEFIEEHAIHKVPDDYKVTDDDIINACLYATTKLSTGIVKLENYSWDKLAPRYLTVDFICNFRDAQTGSHVHPYYYNIKSDQARFDKFESLPKQKGLIVDAYICSMWTGERFRKYPCFG